MIKQKAFRLYPNGYTGNSVKDLNDYLEDGWIVKIVIPENGNNDKQIINVLILEKIELT